MSIKNNVDLKGIKRAVREGKVREKFSFSQSFSHSIFVYSWICRCSTHSHRLQMSVRSLIGRGEQRGRKGWIRRGSESLRGWVTMEICVVTMETWGGWKPLSSYVQFALESEFPTLSQNHSSNSSILTSFRGFDRGSCPPNPQYNITQYLKPCIISHNLKLYPPPIIFNHGYMHPYHLSCPAPDFGDNYSEIFTSILSLIRARSIFVSAERQQFR